MSEWRGERWMNRDIDATRYVHMSIIYSTSCLCPAYMPTYTIHLHTIHQRRGGCVVLRLVVQWVPIQNNTYNIRIVRIIPCLVVQDREIHRLFSNLPYQHINMLVDRVMVLSSVEMSLVVWFWMNGLIGLGRRKPCHGRQTMGGWVSVTVSLSTGPPTIVRSWGLAWTAGSFTHLFSGILT